LSLEFFVKNPFSAVVYVSQSPKSNSFLLVTYFSFLIVGNDFSGFQVQ